MKILGLDISTSITGISILENNDSGDANIILLDKIEFKNCKTFWEKVDLAKNYFDSKEFNLASQGLDKILVEESLQSFRSGMSSALTITTLSKFNSVVSYIAREKFKLDPEYVSATSARKQCGIKIQKTSLIGKNAKEQTFEWAMNGPLKSIVWPLKKNGQPKDWSRDATDAYVIALSGIKKYK
jgi:hypothetical protein